MKRVAVRIILLATVAIVAAPIRPQSSPEPPKTWIDPDTGHRVVPPDRRTRQRQPLFQPERLHGRRQEDGLHHARRHLRLRSANARSASSVVKGRVRSHRHRPQDARTSITARATGSSSTECGYLRRRGEIAQAAGARLGRHGQCRRNAAGRNVHRRRRRRGQSVRAPAAPAAASKQIHPLEQPVNKGQMMEQRLAAHMPMAMFVMNAATGEVKMIHRAPTG